jgi:hypothetical protein
VTTALTTTTTATGNCERLTTTAHAGASWLVRVNVRPEKRKVGSSTLPLTTISTLRRRSFYQAER